MIFASLVRFHCTTRNTANLSFTGSPSGLYHTNNEVEPNDTVKSAVSGDNFSVAEVLDNLPPFFEQSKTLWGNNYSFHGSLLKLLIY